MEGDDVEQRLLASSSPKTWGDRGVRFCPNCNHPTDAAAYPEHLSIGQRSSGVYGTCPKCWSSLGVRATDVHPGDVRVIQSGRAIGTRGHKEYNGMATKKNVTKDEAATDEQKEAVSVAEAVLKEVQENGGGSKRRGANGNGDSTRSPEVLAKERARRQQRYDIHDQIPELHDMDRAWRKKYREAKAVKASKGAESPEAKSAWQAYLDERQKYRVKRGEYGFPIGSKETAEVDETETPTAEKSPKAPKAPKQEKTAIAETGVAPAGKARRMPRVKKSDEGGNDASE